MASYIENFRSSCSWSNVLIRTGSFPLDRSSMFDSIEDAKRYASGTTDEQYMDKRKLSPTSYIGQIITVYEDDKVDVYKINAQRQLESIGGGKGTLLVETVVEAQDIAAKEDSIGQLILVNGRNNKAMYLVKDKNVLIQLFTFSSNNDIVIDCGTY